MRYYLAYGSNLNKSQMRMRCPTANPVGTAILLDMRILFKGSQTGSYLTVEPENGKGVPVGVWEVGALDEHLLDIYEGYPNFYKKVDVEIEVEFYGKGKKKVDAFYYRMETDNPYGMPTTRYFGTCLQGYVDFGFDCEFLSIALKETMSLIKEEQ